MSWSPPVLVLSQLQQPESSSPPSLSEVAMALLTEIFHKWTPPVSYTDKWLINLVPFLIAFVTSVTCPGVKLPCPKCFLYGWSPPMVVMEWAAICEATRTSLFFWLVSCDLFIDCSDLACGKMAWARFLEQSLREFFSPDSLFPAFLSYVSLCATGETMVSLQINCRDNYI